METDFGVVGINCNLKPNVSGASEEIVLSRPFQHELGYAWQSPLRQIASIADNPQYLYRSPLVLYEDDRPLGPRHSQHSKIRQVGLGSFSHWGDIVLFSTSDNSDPNINGRKYKAILPSTSSG